MKDSNGRVDLIIKNAQNIGDLPILNKMKIVVPNKVKEIPFLNVEFAVEKGKEAI